LSAESEPTDERKLATVLFADLVGSTELAGASDPERTRALLVRFYETMAVEIERAGGTVEKFAGDAVMASFGAPAAHEDHAERSLHAALAMQRRLGEVFGDRLALRIGVTTGEVVVGRPHDGSSWATGDAVNVAARLEQAAPPGGILVGERTVAAAGGAFEFAEPTMVEAKGKPGGVACRLLQCAVALMRPRGVRGLHRAFVGREAEIGQLRDVYRRVAENGEPHLVTILGDAGVGKTRLVRSCRSGSPAAPPSRCCGRDGASRTARASPTGRWRRC
ncbi:MAG: adenylate/guanylate cyclase domain-containing protein, partial [Gaiellaceae bacterium]